MKNGPIPERPITHVFCQALKADPMIATRGAYEEVGRSMGPRAGERTRSYLDGQPKGVVGKHKDKKTENENGAAAEERAALRHYR